MPRTAAYRLAKRLIIKWAGERGISYPCLRPIGIGGIGAIDCIIKLIDLSKSILDISGFEYFFLDNIIFFINFSSKDIILTKVSQK